MRGLRLSHEIACLVSTWTPLRSPLRRIIEDSSRPCRRTQSTLIQSSNFLPILSTTLPSLPINLESIFESTTEEYDQVGPSKLDHPPIPRTSQEAILSLLQAKDYVTADSLLMEYVGNGTVIAPHVMFGEQAERLLNQDLNSNWLEWWKLVPPIALSESVTTNYARFCDIQRVGNQRGSRMMDLLLSQPGNLQRLEDFGVIALRSGCIRGVGKSLLSHFAAFGSLESGEKLWNSALRGLQPIPSTAYFKPDFLTVYQQKVAEKREKRTGRFMKTRLETRQKRVRQDAKVFLNQRRAQVIRIHADFGRLEEAIFLAERTIPGRISKFTFVTLLDTLARANRFDLYQKVYGMMKESGGRITRIKNLPNSHKITRSYFARSAMIGRPESLSACKDSFIVSRDANYKDPLGEIENENGAYNDSERHFLDAIGAEDCDSALDELKILRSQRKTPKLKTAAEFITLTRNLGYYEVIERLTRSQRGFKTTRRWHRSFWTTATMLSFIKTGEYLEAVDIFQRIFEVETLSIGLKECVHQVLSQGKVEIRPDDSLKIRTFSTNPFTFTVLLEALVPLVNSDSASHGIKLDDIIRAVTSPVESNSTDFRSSKIDTYSFVPLLEGLFRAKREPIELLNLLHKIPELGLEITKEQWGIVLSSFASLGHSTDLFYLLDKLENQPITILPRSIEIIEKISTLKLPTIGPDHIAYTSMLAGLARRRDFSTARLLQKRLIGRNVNEDQRMGEVMRLLDSWESQHIVRTER